MKFWFNEVTLNYTSNMRHRLDKIIHIASDHDYTPYVQLKPGECIKSDLIVEQSLLNYLNQIIIPFLSE